MTNDQHMDQEDWQRATAARLRRLGERPVDTSRLAEAVERELNEFRPGTRDRAWWAGVFSPIRAVAASLLLIISIVTAVMLTASSGPAYADVAQMAAMHRDLVDSKGMVMHVDSIDAAQRALTQQWPQSPDLPEGLPAGHVMACCLRQVDNKKVACVLLNDGGTPISMMVADANDVRSSRSRRTITQGGVTYTVEQSGDLNMVMANRDGRLVCLIGQRPVDRLIELAKGLHF